MTEENLNASSEDVQTTDSGSAEPVATAHQTAEEAAADFVKYETHNRLLRQRKADQGKVRELEEELNRFRDVERKREQTEMEKRGQYDKILKEREERIGQLEKEREERERQAIQSTKLSAFVDLLPGKLRNNQYLAFVNVDEIAIDPDTKKVDEGSLKSAVDTFMKAHSVLVEPKNTPSLPNRSPQAVTTSQDVEKLSAADKLKLKLAQTMKG